MSYQIADEPHETSLGAYVCKPDAPLLAAMMCGAWLAFPWFIFNSIAMGSPTKRKEIGLCILAVAGTFVLGWGVLALYEAGIIRPGTPWRLCVLAITTWKLGMASYISTVQARTFHVYEYYGGSVRNSATIIGTGYWVADLIISFSDDPLWIIVVSGGI